MLTVQQAAQENKLGLLRALLETNPEALDSLDDDGRTPLHWAASVGAKEIVQFLLGMKAQVDKPDLSGWTALHMATSAGHQEVVVELLGAGADVKRTNDKGLTALHYAASRSRTEIGRLLLERGADVNARDKANQLPLHRAATTGSTAFISILLNPPAGSTKPRLNTGDRIGNTPLHLAMESGHAEAAVMLIEAGADRGRQNSDGQIPEEIEGVGGQEQRRVREYVVRSCGRFDN
ncbi:related to 26s proteasome subunit p28 [Serendipita indica DSM 11827]|uniref:Related to 26s proteasome subunit p28 n=1 Tax=Serendipita indica (strain DSM 11827) TaxID=1109443 RepID=G4TRD8_SERID|nr:related to 26s proteasome subunit p28 [Serendipita indica DSM 11827]